MNVNNIDIERFESSRTSRDRCLACKVETDGPHFAGESGDQFRWIKLRIVSRADSSHPEWSTPKLTVESTGGGPFSFLSETEWHRVHQAATALWAAWHELFGSTA